MIFLIKALTEESFNNNKDQITTGISLKEIGKILKESRESKNLSISEVSDSLKIGEEQLDALEKGEEDFLPEMVFVKAMIRRVCEKLKIEDPSLGIDSSKKILKNNANLQTEAEEHKGNNLPGKTNALSFLKGRKLKPIILYSLIITLLGITAYFRSNRYKEAIDLPKEGINYKANSFQDNLYKKPSDIEIYSIRPSQATIINKKGEILFEGKLKNPLNFYSEDGLEIFPNRPDLIRVQKDGGKTIKLGKAKDLYWYKINNLFIN